ncbi:hypothetical protein PR001_g7642 [Phytophthora rubi]|uniref:Secreted protein n=1 Tax=Phytophthora rubi TaxID=129364 RepID=A0A6A3MUP3_9STRA|nr:hypothetical protein PR002_g7754 [Phytophthora rubi]KAE9039151.1 hypothetical protein PR001_g7642 [Phytophthora rubi]
MICPWLVGTRSARCFLLASLLNQNLVLIRSTCCSSSLHYSFYAKPQPVPLAVPARLTTGVHLVST